MGADHLKQKVKDRLHTHFNETVKNDLSKQLANITTVDSTKLDEVRLLQEETLTGPVDIRSLETTWI